MKNVILATLCNDGLGTLSLIALGSMLLACGADLTDGNEIAEPTPSSDSPHESWGSDVETDESQADEATQDLEPSNGADHDTDASDIEDNASTSNADGAGPDVVEFPAWLHGSVIVHLEELGLDGSVVERIDQSRPPVATFASVNLCHVVWIHDGGSGIYDVISIALVDEPTSGQNAAVKAEVNV